MERLGVFALLFLAAGAAAAAAAGTHTDAPSAARCGGTTWRLKTFSDPQRLRVDVSAQSTTIASIRQRRAPGHLPIRRITAFQLHTWEVPAQATRFKVDSNGSVRLELYDHNSYINAVIPSPACLSAKSRLRMDILAARHIIETCGNPTSNWQSFGPVFFVRGVGYWAAKSPASRGSAPNGAELHPVTGLRVVAGC